VALTRRQREIYDYICDFVKGSGYSPSLEEIAAHFGLNSVATVHKHVQHLVEKGFLRKAWNRSRSLEPVQPAGSGLSGLPLLGTVAAGAPIEAIEDAGAAESIAVPPDMVARIGIRDGDMVVVESRSEARNGDTVVALVGGRDATLKKFYRRGDKIRLVPANPDMEHIEVHASEVEIRGILRGLIRHY